jgi:UDP-N-acetylmuramoylalanine--D-glutamate ligase
MKKICILGQGITAKALRAHAPALNYLETSLEQADFIVTSPGIPAWEMPSTNKEIISEIEFAYRLMQSQKNIPKLIAITGTNGKTTVTSLIAHILNCPAVGNIGLPFITQVKDCHQQQCLAIEVSSYQLEFCQSFKPDIAILLNITPDHMLRHKTMQEYILQKSKIFSQQSSPDLLIVSPEYERLLKKNYAIRAYIQNFSENDPLATYISNPHLRGDHNKQNAMAAFYACQKIGLEQKTILQRINTFPGIEHRIEQVRTINQITFYNDSKATNPEATLVAINSFSQKTHLILCGKDKGLDILPFLKKAIEKVKTMIVFGEISKRLIEVSQQLIQQKKIKSC